MFCKSWLCGCFGFRRRFILEEEVQQKLVEIRKDFAGLEPKDINCIDKTTLRLLQSHTLENAVKPPVLGGFLFWVVWQREPDGC